MHLSAPSLMREATLNRVRRMRPAALSCRRQGVQAACDRGTRGLERCNEQHQPNLVGDGLVESFENARYAAENGGLAGLRCGTGVAEMSGALAVPAGACPRTTNPINEWRPPLHLDVAGQQPRVAAPVTDGSPACEPALLNDPARRNSKQGGNPSIHASCMICAPKCAALKRSVFESLGPSRGRPSTQLS